MKAWTRQAWQGIGAALILAGCTAQAPGIDITLQPITEMYAGQPIQIKLVGVTGQPGEFSLPPVDGLTAIGTGDNPYLNPPEYYFTLMAATPGDFTIPAFDIKSDDGKRYHVLSMTLHVKKSE